MWYRIPRLSPLALLLLFGCAQSTPRESAHSGRGCDEKLASLRKQFDSCEMSRVRAFQQAAALVQDSQISSQNARTEPTFSDAELRRFLAERFVELRSEVGGLRSELGGRRKESTPVPNKVDPSNARERRESPGRTSTEAPGEVAILRAQVERLEGKLRVVSRDADEIANVIFRYNAESIRCKAGKCSKQLRLNAEAMGEIFEFNDRVGNRLRSLGGAAAEAMATSAPSSGQ